MVDGGGEGADNPPVLILARHEVEAALDRDRLVDALAAAMAELSSGAASVPNRTAARVEAVGGALMAMPAHVPGAGALAAKKIVPVSAGTFPTDGGLFVGLLIGVILIIGGLTFFPALSLGPIVEHLAMQAGTLF